jgi:hypothetical protein
VFKKRFKNLSVLAEAFKIMLILWLEECHLQRVEEGFDVIMLSTLLCLEKKFRKYVENR